IGAACLIALAIADERADLPRGMRFLVQLGVALTTALATAVWMRGAGGPPPDVGTRAVLFAVPVFWITWLVNAYNFMDGVNGMAAAGAIVCGATLAVLFGRTADGGGQALALALA